MVVLLYLDCVRLDAAALWLLMVGMMRLNLHNNLHRLLYYYYCFIDLLYLLLMHTLTFTALALLTISDR